MKRLALLLPILFALPVTSWAEQGDLPYRTAGLFVGAGLGVSNVEMNSGAIKIDSGDTSKRIFIGYRLPYSPKGINIALQGAYFDLGNAHDTPLDSTFSLKVDGFDFSAIAYFPITQRWDLLAKAGAAVWDSKLKGWAPPGWPPPRSEITDSYSDTDLTLGFGASFNTNSALGFQVEVERMNLLDGAWVAWASGTYQFK
jgi:hypothetical protein